LAELMTCSPSDGRVRAHAVVVPVGGGDDSVAVERASGFRGIGAPTSKMVELSQGQLVHPPEPHTVGKLRVRIVAEDTGAATRKKVRNVVA